jgi:pyruvate-formate lyase-activating enzyme
MTNFEILPYHKLGLTKYRDLKISNSLVKVHEPSKLAIKKAKQLILGSK